MDTPRRRTRILRAIALGALCCLLFVVPSAWIVHREWPRWLAAAIGLLAFPVLPVGWHLLAERRRRRKVAEPAKPGKPPREGLSAHDRFLLRLLAVSAVFLLPLAVFDRGGAWDAIRDDGIWFARWGGGEPATPPATSAAAGDRSLFQHPPADTQAMVWIDGSALPAEPFATGRPAAVAEVLIAFNEDDIAAFVRGSAANHDVLLGFMERRGLFARHLQFTRAAPGVDVVATLGWVDAEPPPGGHKPPPAALVDLVTSSRASGRLAVAAARPTGSIAGAVVQSATGWVTRVGDDLVFEATATVSSGDAALRQAVRGAIDEVVAIAPAACIDQVKAIVPMIEIGGTGNTVTARATIPAARIASLARCVLHGSSGEH